MMFNQTDARMLVVQFDASLRLEALQELKETLACGAT